MVSSDKTFVPWVERLVDVLQAKCEEIGTCAGVLRISDIFTGNGDNNKADRFIVTFPYGGQHIRWEVIFNANHPHLSPDFIFLSDNQSFFPDIDKLQHLTNWDPKNEASLFLVFQELIREYKNHHLKLLSGSRLEFDYNSLIPDGKEDGEVGEGVVEEGDAEEGTPRLTVEVHVMEKNELCSGPIQFMVRLPVNFKSLPPVFTPENQGLNKVLTLVTYDNLDGGNVHTQVCLSPRVEQAFNQIGGLPHISFPHEGCINDYVACITQQLQKMVNQLSESFEKKREFVCHVVSIFASHVIEFDAVAFKKVSLLFAGDLGHILIIIDIPATFPNIQPVLTFISTTSYMKSNQPVQKQSKNFPFSPRWPCNEMISRLKLYLQEQLPSLDRDLNIDLIL